jgi:hypothetical protein
VREPAGAGEWSWAAEVVGRMEPARRKLVKRIRMGGAFW